jgi:hypothetical protein
VLLRHIDGLETKEELLGFVACLMFSRGLTAPHDPVMEAEHPKGSKSKPKTASLKAKTAPAKNEPSGKRKPTGMGKKGKPGSGPEAPLPAAA